MKCDWCYDKGEEVLLDLPGGPSIPCRSCNLGELVAAVMRDRTRPEVAEPVTVSRGFLREARCPNRNCDNGNIITYNMGEAEIEQCQWCDEKAQTLREPQGERS